jgi:hypothetical protein
LCDSVFLEKGKCRVFIFWMGGGILVVKFVNDKREMTTWEARGEYKGLYIGFITTKRAEKLCDQDNHRGRVLYTADTYNEQYEIPAKTEDGQYISRLYGFGLKDLPMGGVIVAATKK